MIGPVLRMVGDALADVTTGVNAKIAALTTDSGDQKPANIVDVLVAADDDEAAKTPLAERANVPDWPVLIVATNTPGEIQWNGVTGKGYESSSFPVFVFFVTNDGADAAQAWRDTDYTMRCAVRAIRAGLLASTPAAVAARTRGDIRLAKCNRMTWETADFSIVGGRVRAVLTLDLHIQDNNP